MGIFLAVLLAPAVIWLAAGLVADGLSAAPTIPRLRRRIRALRLLVYAGLTGTGVVTATALLNEGAAPGGDAGSGAVWPAFLLPALALPAIPALVVAARTVRRLRWLGAGASAFATAPETPVPPALRAAAAHPLVVFPVQLTGLVLLPASGTAAGAAAGAAPLADPGMVGPVLTTIVAVAVMIGVRQGLRHSRLVERAVTLRPPPTRAGGLLSA